MKTCLRRGVVGALLLTLAAARPAEGSPATSIVHPVIEARAAVLVDASDGKVLFAHNADERRAIASLTKVMTALVVIERTKPTDAVTASPAAEKIGENDPIVTELELVTGERLSVEQLLYGLLLPSANDAAVALAEHVGGSVTGFAKLMNEEAAKLGATNSHFTNPHGLDEPGHVSTAGDLAKIARAAMSKPLFRKVVATKTYDIPWTGHPAPRTLANRNPLLGAFPGTTGIKTGQTLAAGKSLVSSATQGGETRIAVVLASSKVANDSMSLLDHGFSRFKRHAIATKGKVWGTGTYGDGTTVRLRAKRTFAPLVAVGFPPPTVDFREKTTSLAVHIVGQPEAKVPLEARCPPEPCEKPEEAYPLSVIWSALGPLARTLAALR